MNNTEFYSDSSRLERLNNRIKMVQSRINEILSDGNPAQLNNLKNLLNKLKESKRALVENQNE